MEVDFPSPGPRWIERVRIKGSAVACAAETVRPFALLFADIRHHSPGIREALAEQRFDPSATGAEAFCFELG